LLVQHFDETLSRCLDIIDEARQRENEAMPVPQHHYQHVYAKIDEAALWRVLTQTENDGNKLQELLLKPYS
jgi:hypothetical protein